VVGFLVDKAMSTLRMRKAKNKGKPGHT